MNKHSKRVVNTALSMVRESDVRMNKYSKEQRKSLEQTARIWKNT